MSDFLEHLGACRELCEGVTDACSRILLVGEDNPYGSTPEWALYCAPEGCSGERLQSRILGLRTETYLALWRTNLCAGSWSMKKARERSRLLLGPSVPWRTIVMLGRKVAGAFEGAIWVQVQAFRTASWNGVTLVSLPHPSRRNTQWNDPRRAQDARVLLSEVAPKVPWGEAL